MNDQTEKLINETLAGILEGAAQTKAFVLSEAPEIVEQLIRWKIATNSIGVFTGLILLGVGPWFISLVLKGIKLEKEESGSGGDYFNVGFAGALVSFLVGAPLFFTSLLDLVQLVFAPKLYIIEYAASLIR